MHAICTPMRMLIHTHSYIYRALAVCCLLMLCGYVRAQEETPLLLPDTSVLFTDTLPGLPDTTATKHAEPVKPDAIDAPIAYKAKDSIVLLGNGTAFLHGTGNIQYKTMDLSADFIRVKTDSSTIHAVGVYDSIADDWTGRPVFKDGDTEYESYEMNYNLKTKKAYIRHVVTEQGEGYIVADKTKKMEGDEMMMAGGKYTTCDDHDHPHFYLQLTKAKMRPGEYAATGPVYLVVGDVPLPVALPFAFFPFTSTYSSGLIMPQFGEEQQAGLYLRGLGYYFALSDYADLEVTGDIYTRGTWAVTARSKYKWRYHFSGNLSMSYRNDIRGEKGMPDYSKSTSFSVNWTHSQDSKANPYSNFSASVNFSTSGYDRTNLNAYYDLQKTSQNTKSSSINYTQRFPDSPWSLSMSALVSQRTKDSTISLTLPDLSVNMATIYPFKRKKAIGKEKWYEKIQFKYSANAKISTTAKEKELLHSNFLRDWQTGVKHNMSTSASFTILKYLTLSPSITYGERWNFQRVDQSWDEMQNQLVRDTTNGFYRVWDLSMSVSASTKLYGFFIPSRKLFPNSKVDRFRHVFTPSISLNYTPDCDHIRAKIGTNYYGSYEKPIYDKDGNLTEYQTVEYNRFQGCLNGVPSRGNVGSVGFSLGNNLEMKVLDRKDTTGTKPYKVVSLIDAFNISGGYNMMADSMNWSNFSVNLRIKLPKPLNYTINLSGQFDPYLYKLNADGRPVRTNTRCWQEGKFLHFKGTSTSFSYTFNNQTFKKWFGGENKDKKGPEIEYDPTDPTSPNYDPLYDPDDPENIRAAQEKKKKKEAEDKAKAAEDWTFAEIPWSFSISYTIRYGESNIFDYDKMNYKMQFTHNLSFSASLGLGKGWKASTSTSYDFKAKKFAAATISINRDLHCWSMSASINPFGPFKSYSFHIGVNAGMLSDLKYDKSSADATNKAINWW